MTNPFDRFDEEKNSFDRFDTPKPSTSAVGRAVDTVMDPVNTGVNWLGTQFTKAGTSIMGAPRAIADMNQGIAEYAGNKLGFPETGQAVGKALRWVNPNPLLANYGPSTDQLNQTVFGTFGVPEVNAGDSPALTLKPPILGGGEINVGKMLDVGAQALPAAALGAGGILPNFLSGVTSEAAGQATQGTPYELPARIVGGIPGAMAGARITTPLPANLSPQGARAVALAKENGIPLSVAEETGRGQGIERFLSRMPGGQGLSEKFAGKQGAATDAWALKQAGYTGNELGQDTMKSLATQTGNEFNAAKNMPGVIDLTPTFPRVKSAVADYENIMDPAKRSPAVTTEAGRILSKEAPTKPTYSPLTASAVERPATMDALTTAVRNASKPVNEAFDALPTIKGWFDKGPMAPMPKELPELSNTQYQTLRSGLSKTVDGLYAAGDTNGAKALQAMRTSLDDAAEASLGPDKLAAWQQARRHYYNFKVLERAMNNGTTSARSEGTLGAAALDRALKAKQGDSYYRTTGGLNDVATVKGYLRDTFPNSGTPTMVAGMANVAGMGLPAVGANMALRPLLGGGLISGGVRNYLANQTMPNTISSGLQGMSFGVAPGMLTDQQRLRLMDQRGQ